MKVPTTKNAYCGNGECGSYVNCGSFVGDNKTGGSYDRTEFKKGCFTNEINTSCFSNAREVGSDRLITRAATDNRDKIILRNHQGQEFNVLFYGPLSLVGRCAREKYKVCLWEPEVRKINR